MAKAEDLAKAAEKAKKVEEKPLPMMVSPTVNLVVELRQAVALRTRDTEESFSTATNKMWLDLLKKEQRVPETLQPDFSAKRVGGGLKLKLEEKEALVAELQKQLEELKKAKK